MSEIIDSVEFPAGTRVLEMGCGENRNPGSTVAVDVRATRCTDFTVDFNVPPYPIGDADFDVVFSQFMVEHLDYPVVPEFLKECRRIVKPGGMIVLVVPNTEEQLKWIQRHPEGWDGKDFYESASNLLFGSQTYRENHHSAFFSPMVAVKLLTDAGFRDVSTIPFGTAGTDMLVRAKRPEEDAPAVVEAKPEEPLPGPEVLYAKDYWNGGAKFGGYAGEGYRDFGVHEVTFRHVMARRPESVLELGAARGYVGKKLEDAGVRYCGLEVSRHCWMTRVVDAVVPFDLCKTVSIMEPGAGDGLPDGRKLWPFASEVYSADGSINQPYPFDLSFSIAVFEHIPEEFLPGIFSELKRTTKRGLHGIDFGAHDDAFDKTHVTLRPKHWWRAKFDAAGLQSHEIVDKEELEKGDYQHGLPIDYLRGDGKTKINLGSFTSMVHHGWTNIDQHDLGGWAQANHYAYVRHDITKGIPVQTGVVDLIFMHHVFEHFDYATGLSLLRECRRAIKRDGAMRIVVPDLAELAYCYVDQDDPGRLKAFNEINDECEKAPTDAMRLHALLQGGDHRAFYDMGTLCHQLNEAGWVASPASFRKTSVDKVKQILKETTEFPFGSNPGLSLFVDAVPRLG